MPPFARDQQALVEPRAPRAARGPRARSPQYAATLRRAAPALVASRIGRKRGRARRTWWCGQQNGLVEAAASEAFLVDPAKEKRREPEAEQRGADGQQGWRRGIRAEPAGACWRRSSRARRRVRGRPPSLMRSAARSVCVSTRTLSGAGGRVCRSERAGGTRGWAGRQGPGVGRAGETAKCDTRGQARFQCPLFPLAVAPAPITSPRRSNPLW